ncbi:MAG: hypothetical protein JW987_03625 [Anaerolineaceae bacterium]|nr:hypothetical protein [Anaerolineaceae bacterium]
MKKSPTMDERTERLNGQVSFLVLMLTHLALAIAILYKRYIQGLDVEYYQTFTAIQAASMFLYWGMRLYLSGVLPMISWRALLGIYAALVMMISIPSALIHGLPTAQNWTSTILPAMLGPAVLVVGYWLIAYFGKRRLDKEISE